MQGDQELQDLRESEAFLREIMASISDSVLTCDAQGALTFVCPNVLYNFGYSREELWQRGSIDAVFGPGLFSAAEIPHLGDQIHNREWTILTKDQQARQLLVTIKHIAIRESRYLICCRDVSERSQVTQALHESEARFRTLFEHSPDAVFVAEGESGMIVDANQRAQNLSGYSLAELRGMHQSQLHPPEEMARVQACFLEHSQQSPPDPVELHLACRDGSAIPVEIFTSGHILFSHTRLQVGIFHDIRQRRAAEQQLQKQEQTLRTILENLNDCVWSLSYPDLQPIFISPSAERLFEHPLDDFYSQPLLWQKIALPEDREGVDRAFESLISTGSSCREWRIMLSDGQVHWRCDHAKLIYADDNPDMPIRIDGISRDITERKLAEIALRESEAHLRAITDAARDAIIVMDGQGRITFWNPAAEDLFGWKREDAIGQDLHQLLAPSEYQDSYQPALQHFFRSGAGAAIGHTRELEARHANGERFPIELSLSALPLGEDWHAVGILKDISERKRHEARLQAATTAAEAASQAKSQFLANMSHEIRTPMNGVIGMTSLLLDTALDEQQRHYGQVIRSSAESLLTIINDILDFSKIEAGKLELENIDFCLLGLLDDWASTLALRAQEKGLELLYSADPHLPDWLCGDPGRLRQILSNLVSNAIKFTDQGEIVVRVQACDMQPNPDQVRLRCSVRDTGIGIPADKVDQLFQLFEQVDASNARRYGGTGLGLAISKQLSELMGGAIGVSSQVGQGSEFWFEVCLALGEAPSTDPALLQATSFDGVRVLIVDDNACNREILYERLNSWGMRSTTVGCAQDALQHLEEAAASDPYALALIDMQMPGMDGLALGAAISARSHLAQTHLLMLTSTGMRGDAQRCAACGFSAYLSKPVRHDELRCLAADLLRDPAKPALKGTIRTRYNLPQEALLAKQGHILLVEDTPVNQLVITSMLQRMGLSVDCVADGLQALSALRDTEYDLVLMDVQMPVMDGLEATRQIRDPQQGLGKKTLPIIALTANAMSSDRDACLAAGMNAFLAKPVSMSDLSRLIQEWLGSAPEESGS